MNHVMANLVILPDYALIFPLFGRLFSILLRHSA